jgi:hypothetical protein
MHLSFRIQQERRHPSIYQSFSVGENVYLSCHIDKGAIYSAVTVVHHKDR